MTVMWTKTIRSLLVSGAMALLLALGLGSSALAGGIHVSVELPPSVKGKSSSQFKDTVLLVRVSGCFDKKDAGASARAEGLVNGKRKAVDLKVTKIEDGFFAVKGDWGKEGAWALVITGTGGPMTSHVVVEAGPKGLIHTQKKNVDGRIKEMPIARSYYGDELKPADVTATLRRLADRIG
jgi:hypothetical protein